MKDAVPFGEAESESLEFKGRDALNKPSSISREVVAMLNAEGGEVWVGIAEASGRAATVEAIEEPVRKERALWDHFIEAIEPAPQGGEVKLMQVKDPAGDIFRITVRPEPSRRPYAQLKDGGRHFPIRVGDRIRPMSREEIFAMAPRKTSTADRATDKWRGRLLRDRELRLKSGKVFWLRVQPCGDLDLDLQDKKLREYLADPAATGNRSMGWTFVSSEQPIPSRDRLTLGDPAYRQLEVHRDGALVLTYPYGALPWNKDKTLHPYPLMEFPVSVFRLAKAIYAGAPRKKAQQVLADLAFFDILGWRLRPHSPKAIGYELSQGSIFDRDKDLVWDKPVELALKDVVSEPDRCALRLIRRVYEAFGHPETTIPHEFNRENGRLILPQ